MADKNYVIDEPDAAKAKYGIQGSAICKRLINFDTGSAKVLGPHQQGLSEIKAQLRTEGDTIYIIGHASKRGGAHFNNKKLSEDRANAVRDWFAYYMDTHANHLHVSAEGDTATLGGVDPDDPKDRAVVIIAQNSDAPWPRVLPPPQLPDPWNPPDDPLPTPTLPLLRQTGWKFDGQGSLTGSVSFINEGPLSVSAVVGGMSISLKKMSTEVISRYQMLGSGIAASVGLNPLEKIPRLGDTLKRIGLNFGPSSFPNPGTEILATPLMREPISAESFAGPAFLLSPGATATALQGAVSLLLFSRFPISPTPMPMDPGLATITALCSFAGPSLTLPGLSAGIDRFGGNLMLQKR